MGKGNNRDRKEKKEKTKKEKERNKNTFFALSNRLRGRWNFRRPCGFLRGGGALGKRFIKVKSAEYDLCRN